MGHPPPAPRQAKLTALAFQQHTKNDINVEPNGNCNTGLEN
jgi:hypothetical protein